jgi:uncharacterized membrane protein YjjP (DUF1212 family)
MSREAPTPTPALAESDQRDITDLCLTTGLLLLQHGAESALVDSVTSRLGVALGAERTEVAILSNALSVTTVHQGHAITVIRRSVDRGINMHLVTEAQRAMLDVEAQALDREGFRRRIHAIVPWRYPRWMVALAIGVSCACFARLGHADATACLLTLVASTAAMGTRQFFVSLHFNPLVSFFIAAFVATSIASQGLIYQWGTTPKVAMASCVLLLVPGFPMINSVSDMVKGHYHSGVARAVMATLLGGATAGGIVLAMIVWRVWGWL